MNAKDSAKSVAQSQGPSGAAAAKIVGSPMSTIAEAVATGAEVSLPRFGKFRVRDRLEQAERNAATGEAIMDAATKKLTFTPVNALKDRL